MITILERRRQRAALWRRVRHGAEMAIGAVVGGALALLAVCGLLIAIDMIRLASFIAPGSLIGGW
ncbi:hypothetical protein ACRARG_12695 [Pseudooceanicola sp. C21-150M6]|uniref:hypothetical protein n=1 Tax=Pseudooceanicola sp. C21-150M6 TaxID=3434355 RepID=UPI003D7F320C